MSKPRFKAKQANSPYFDPSWGEVTLAQFAGITRTIPSREVGVEFEIEMISPYGGATPPAYRLATDGSLRGFGYEFIFQQPLGRDVARGAIEELEGVLPYKSIVKNCGRASTHFHLNVSNLTSIQILTLMSLWYVVEEAVTLTLPAHRQGNLHALRLVDADNPIMELTRFLSESKERHVNDAAFPFLFRDSHRYAALNLASLTKFGSLEFRVFPGIDKKGMALPWLNALLDLYDGVLKGHFNNPQDIITLFSGSSPGNFVRSNFPNTWELIRDVPGVDDVLRRGMRFAQEIAYSVPNWRLTDKPVKKSKKTAPTAKLEITRPRRRRAPIA